MGNSLNKLNHSWRTHSSGPIDFGPIGTWTIDDLVIAIRAADHTDRDHLLLHLLTCAAGDSASARSAQHTLLKTMRPKIQRLSRISNLQDLSPEDADATALTAMWEAIRTYPLHRVTSVAGNLGYRALQLLTKAYPHINEEINADLGGMHVDGSHDAMRFPGSHTTEARMINQSVPRDPQDDRNLSPDEELATVLRWARETHTLTDAEIELLARTHSGDRDTLKTIAAEEGIQPDSLRRRVDRLRTRLRKAIAAHISEFGTW